MSQRHNFSSCPQCAWQQRRDCYSLARNLPEGNSLDGWRPTSHPVPNPSRNFFPLQLHSRAPR